MPPKKQRDYVDVAVRLTDKDEVATFRQMAQEQGYDTAAAFGRALIQAGIENYPKWGVQKGIMRLLKSRLRVIVSGRMHKVVDEVIRAELGEVYVEGGEDDENLSELESETRNGN